MMFSSIKALLYGGAGAAAALLLFSIYTTLIENPSIVKETRATAFAEAQAQTLKAINEVNDEADRARALRRFCRDSGRVYSYSSNSCN